MAKRNKFSKKIHGRPKIVADAPKRSSRRKICRSNKKRQRKSKRVVKINCTICKNSSHGVPKVLKCRHLFHRNCFRRWIKNSTGNCPRCKKGIPTNSGLHLQANSETSRVSINNILSSMTDYHVPSEPHEPIPDLDNETNDIVNLTSNLDNSNIDLDDPEARPESVDSILTSMTDDHAPSESIPDPDNQTIHKMDQYLNVDNSNTYLDEPEAGPDSVDSIFSPMIYDQSSSEPFGPIPDPDNLSIELDDPSSNLYNSNMDLNYPSSNFSILNIDSEDTMHQQLSDSETRPDSSANLRPLVLCIPKSVYFRYQNLNNQFIDLDDQSHDSDNSSIDLDDRVHQQQSNRKTRPNSSAKHHSLELRFRKIVSRCRNQNLDNRSIDLSDPPTYLYDSNVDLDGSMHQQQSNPESVEDILSIMCRDVPTIPSPISDPDSISVDLADPCSYMDSSNADVDESRHQRRSNPEIRRDFSANSLVLRFPKRVTSRRKECLGDRIIDLGDPSNDWNGLNMNVDHSYFHMGNSSTSLDHPFTNLHNPTIDVDYQSSDSDNSRRDSDNTSLNTNILTKVLPQPTSYLVNPSVEVPGVFIPVPCYRCQRVSNDQPEHGGLDSNANITSRRILWEDKEFCKQIRKLRRLLGNRDFTLKVLNSPSELEI